MKPLTKTQTDVLSTIRRMQGAGDVAWSDVATALGDPSHMGRTMDALIKRGLVTIRFETASRAMCRAVE